MYASDVTVNTELVKKQLSSSNLIKYLPSDTTVEASDITIINVSNANDAEGSLTIEISIGNWKTWKDASKVESQTFPPVSITGFLKRKPTTWVDSPDGIKEDTLFENIYADQFGEDKIKEYIISNHNKFYLDAPSLTVNDLIIEPGTLVQNKNEGIVSFTLKLTKFYDPTTAVLKTDPTGNSFPSHNFVLKGFDTRLTSLKNGGRFNYSDLWTGVPKSLDDDNVNVNYFITAIEDKQDIIFNECPKIAKADILDPNLSVSVNTGVAEFSFNLANSRPTPNAHFTIVVSGFTKKVTAVRGDGTFKLGVANKANIIADKAWITQTITEHQDTIFENLPTKGFNFATDVTVLEDSINTSKAGEVSFDVQLVHVYNVDDTLKTTITITGFKADALTTELMTPALSGW